MCAGQGRGEGGVVCAFWAERQWDEVSSGGPPGPVVWMKGSGGHGAGEKAGNSQLTAKPWMATGRSPC